MGYKEPSHDSWVCLKGTWFSDKPIWDTLETTNFQAHPWTICAHNPFLQKALHVGIILLSPRSIHLEYSQSLPSKKLFGVLCKNRIYIYTAQWGFGQWSPIYGHILIYLSWGNMVIIHFFVLKTQQMEFSVASKCHTLAFEVLEQRLGSLWREVRKRLEALAFLGRHGVDGKMLVFARKKGDLTREKQVNQGHIFLKQIQETWWFNLIQPFFSWKNSGLKPVRRYPWNMGIEDDSDEKRWIQTINMGTWLDCQRLVYIFWKNIWYQEFYA